MFGIINRIALNNIASNDINPEGNDLEIILN